MALDFFLNTTYIDVSPTFINPITGATPTNVYYYLLTPSYGDVITIVPTQPLTLYFLLIGGGGPAGQVMSQAPYSGGGGTGGIGTGSVNCQPSVGLMLEFVISDDPLYISTRLSFDYNKTEPIMYLGPGQAGYEGIYEIGYAGNGGDGCNSTYMITSTQSGVTTYICGSAGGNGGTFPGQTNGQPGANYGPNAVAGVNGNPSCVEVILADGSLYIANAGQGGSSSSSSDGAAQAGPPAQALFYYYS